MKRVKITVAYDGTNYCGWQIQPNGITIEEVLNKTLSELLGEPIAVIGASRTDSGVHAEGNVAVFDTDNRMPADKICFALNQRLPADIRVLQSEEVCGSYHPRKQNCIKTYEYKILNRKIDMPTQRLYSHFCYFPLEVEKMRAGAAFLVGEHDFKSFCTVRSQAEETVRTIYSLDIVKSGDLITIRISGSGFLYNMVRIIAGTLIKVGTGAWPPEMVEEILDARERTKAGPKAPARGLTLVSLEYEKELKKEIIGQNKSWKYRLIQTEISEKKKAYLVIERCVNENFDSLFTRVVHQAVRNGAEQVFVCDKEDKGRIVIGKHYGYYTPVYVYDMLRLEKIIKKDQGSVESSRLTLEPVRDDQLAHYVELHNEVFYPLPNSQTMTLKDISEFKKDDKCDISFIKYNDKMIGFMHLSYQKNRFLEICSFGILNEYQGQGFGHMALVSIEQLAAKQGIESLYLTVCSSHTKALALYHSVGFGGDQKISSWYMAHS